MERYDAYLLAEYKSLGSVPELKVAVDYYNRTHTKSELEADVKRLLAKEDVQSNIGMDMEEIER